MSLLVVRGLTVSARGVPVLRGLDLSLEPGKVLGLVGESGAGKSMVGRAIANVMPPGFAVTGGELRFAGESLPAMTARRRRGLLGRDIAFIPQEPLTALNPVRRVGAQMDEHFRHLGVEGREERRARAVAALQAVHLPDPASVLMRYPHQLSGGMCQRVLIAMAFASRPRLVIADEPTTALDVTIQARIIALMTELRGRDGTAVLFITHDLRLAARFCDEIAVLYAGAVVESGLSARHPYTKCLQLATPDLGPQRALYALPDQMPGLHALAGMTGCRFAPRCPVASEECRQIDPPMVDGAACLFPERTGGIVAGEDAAIAHAPGDGAVLEVAGVSKWFGRSVAVREAGFCVAPGEFVALVGESGSGKTTLGRLVMGLERADAGRIALDGVDVSQRAHRVRTAQMVFQDSQSALNPRRLVSSIVTQALEAVGVQDPARAAKLLVDMGMAAELGRRYPGQLSGGQRQRVNIARALCVVPRLLVADEIVSGLDVSVQAQLLLLLRRLRAEHGFAMLFISHDLSVVRHLCERVLVMYRGEIVEDGPTDAVFASPRHAYTQSLLASALR